MADSVPCGDLFINSIWFDPPNNSMKEDKWIYEGWRSVNESAELIAQKVNFQKNGNWKKAIMLLLP